MNKYRRSTPRIKGANRKQCVLYRAWAAMIHRCNTPTWRYYHRYGGRGISVCDEWRSYDNFRAWAVSNGFRKNLSLDRIDNNGNYKPGNCRWATPLQQSRNTRFNRWITFGGKKQLITDWAADMNVSIPCLIWRLKNGWSVERTLTTPSNRPKDTQ